MPLFFLQFYATSTGSEKSTSSAIKASLCVKASSPQVQVKGCASTGTTTESGNSTLQTNKKLIIKGGNAAGPEADKLTASGEILKVGCPAGIIGEHVIKGVILLDFPRGILPRYHLPSVRVTGMHTGT